MAKRISRRKILGFGAATIAGSIALFAKDGHAQSPAGGSLQYQPSPGPQNAATTAVLGEELQRRADRRKNVVSGFTWQGL